MRGLVGVLVKSISSLRPLLLRCARGRDVLSSPLRMHLGLLDAEKPQNCLWHIWNRYSRRVAEDQSLLVSV